MYKKSEINKALEVYNKVQSIRRTIKILEYPNRRTLKSWIQEFQATGTVREKNGSGRSSKYTEEDKQRAITYALEHGRCITRTCRELGYPSVTLLRTWLKDTTDKTPVSSSVGSSIPFKHTEETKLRAVALMRNGKQPVIHIARQFGVSRQTLYAWAKEFPVPQTVQEGLSMRGKKQPRLSSVPLQSNDEAPISDVTLKKVRDLEKQVKLLATESEQLQEQIQKLRLQKDVLVKAAEVLKKEGGVNLNCLSNHDKFCVIDALRKKYKLKDLLSILSMSKSSYCYQSNRCDPLKKYEEIRKKIKSIFNNNYETYGYRRIWFELRNNGVKISEKIVRHLMKIDGLRVRCHRIKKYSSYVGEISPSVPNLINRDFHADLPNEKWLTDITEFALPAGKVYLSPIIDCFDGMPVAWSISTSPTKELANSMLRKAIQTLKEGESPIIHSDRGGHYRWPEWIDLTRNNSLIRSMSNKGCSPDNSACEGFFGLMKNEMFYGRNWLGISLQEFMQKVDTYLYWYREKRIKLGLGGMSPLVFRQCHEIGHPAVFKRLNEIQGRDYNIIY